MRLLSTFFVFCASVLVTYFLSDFYNDINDSNRVNFSRQESETLGTYIDERLDPNPRGHMYASLMRTISNVTLEQYRGLGSLPDQPPIALGEDVVGGGPDSYIWVRRVLHKDRESFERFLSEQYNQTLTITDFNTQETLDPKPFYWVYTFHPANAPVVARDVSTEPGRYSAVLSLLESGNVSYSPPVVSIRDGTLSFLKAIELVTTPEGDIGVMTRFTNLNREVEENTNIIEFINGGNNGRRVVIRLGGENETELVYEEGTGGGDLIYSSSIQKTNAVFVFEVYERTKFDNSSGTFVFMSIGFGVSLVLAGWELFRSRASIRAEEASVAKSKFLSTIAHEIRTPINGIVGITDVLSQLVLSDTASNYVDILVSCSTSLISLLNNVLDMSKIDAGKIEDNKTEFLLKNLVMRTVRDAWEVLKAKKSPIDHINVIITENVPLGKILSNETHLYQILNNLMSNAVKFTDDGYVEVKVDATPRDHESILVSISVRDTGIGMSQEAANGLFKPFSRIHNGNKERNGTGLGLVISRKLTKSMGGNLKCTSVLGKGTIFVATFVLKQHDFKNESSFFFSFNREDNNDGAVLVHPDHGPDSSLSVRADTKFLVVDDNSINRLVMKKMLQSSGAVNIDTATDGIESLNFTRRSKYDIIFMDKFMPLMNGVEATRHIRSDSDSKSKNTPIIFFSADVENETISECIDAGGSGFIGKPYRLAVLLEKMKKVDNSDIFDLSQC